MIGPKKGDVLLEKYRIEREIGKGGMGVVVCARHIALDDRVAIKLLLPEALSERDNVARFIREARAARQIRGEHVPHVFDVGTLPTGEYYIVMEYLEGSDLAEVRRNQKTLPIVDAVDYVIQACEALAEAHAKGIVHRDLKPANLFLTHRADGSPLIKVLDFGISKLNDRGAVGQDFGKTRTGMILGSPSYMAPEQIGNPKLVDPRADIWALGVILYFLLTGRLPFEAETLGQVLLRIMNTEPAAPRSIRLDLPEELEAVLQRCLEKSPEKRFENVAALAAALEPFGPAGGRLSVERISRVLRVSSDVKKVKGGTIKMPAGQPPMDPSPPRSDASEGDSNDARPNTAAMSVWDRTLAGLRSAMRTTSSFIGIAVLCAVLLGLAVALTIRRGSTSEGSAASAPSSSESGAQPSVVLSAIPGEPPVPIAPPEKSAKPAENQNVGVAAPSISAKTVPNTPGHPTAGTTDKPKAPKPAPRSTETSILTEER